MDSSLFGVIEVLLVFGVVLAWLFYELFSVRRATRRAREAEEQAKKTQATVKES